MFAYLKSRDFPIHLLAYWWVFWLVLSCTELNEFTAPSAETFAQYAMLIGSFLTGHWLIRYRRTLGFGAAQVRNRASSANNPLARLAIRISALACAGMLLVSLWLAGAFADNFLEYFAKLRLTDEDVVDLTGSRALDVLTKIFAFPLSYTMILVILADNLRRYRYTFVVCIFNLLAYSYLWQVNYPLIHLFWFLVFHLLIRAHRRGSFDMRTMMITLVIFSGLLASAVNRFGGDLIGGLQRYIVGYHLVGFSFYDHQYHDPRSILHEHTFGRTSLGFIDQMFEATLKRVGLEYKAASSENATYNNDAVDIGAREVKEFNAFGTLLFGLYRDFHLLGIVVGGFLYGALATHALRGSDRNWMCGALFIFLASTWMIGMMVNPVEQAYFWFAVVALAGFGLVNNTARRRATT